MADLNQLAAKLVGRAVDDEEPAAESEQAKAGRKGGEKGGEARANRLSPARRSEIARKAARARWS